MEQHLTSGRRLKRRAESELYKKVVVAILLVSFLLCVAVFAICIFFVMHSDDNIIFMKNKHANRHTPIACVQCDDLIKHTYGNNERDPLIDKLRKEGAEDQCCAYNSDQMSTLLELSMRRKVEKIKPLPAFSATNFTFSRAFAHIELHPPAGLDGNDESPEFKEVNATMNKEMIEMGEFTMTPESDGLKIQHPGVYQVYSMVNFNPKSSDLKCKNFTHQTFIFDVLYQREGHSGPSKLLSAAHTCCDECKQEDKTKYISGVFQLEKGDVVQVRLSAQNVVYFKKTSSYLGLMMLGNGDSIS